MVWGEDSSFDLARFDDIFCEHAQHGLVPHLETQSLHTAEQLPLGVTCAREEKAEPDLIVPELRPFGALSVEHEIYSASYAVKNRAQSPHRQLSPHNVRR